MADTIGPDTIRELAESREAAWLEKHGQHDYVNRDLQVETLEELADAYNYLKALGESFWANQVRKLGDDLAHYWAHAPDLGAERGE